jgi:hypothetical protein
MIYQPALFKLQPVEPDIVYTPKEVVKDIMDWLQPKGICLDPCFGDGAFFEQMPDGADWCELRKGRDFFDYNKRVDWIIGNPPYSIFEDWLRHSFELANDVAYILPTNKVFQRQIIMQMINDFGGIKGMRIYGSGSMVGFPFGFSVGAFHFCRGHKTGCNLMLVAKTT